jgi:DNA-directed RNA polymerase specialized sigma24 family protein
MEGASTWECESMNGTGSCQEFLEECEHKTRTVARKALWVMHCTNPESHSEDVASDVIRKVIAHWDNLVSPENALYKIIINTARDHIKVCPAEVAQEINVSASPCFVRVGQDPEEMLSDAILISELLSHLSQIERNVIEMV